MWTASINDHIRAVRDVSLEHANNILISLEAVGLDVHAKREGFPLPYINVDALPILDASEREILRYIATGEPWLEAEKQRRRERAERFEEWCRSWLSMLPCLTLNEDEPGSGPHVQGEAGPAVATATGDQACVSSAVLAVPSQQQPLCRRRGHQGGTQEVPAGDT